MRHNFHAREIIETLYKFMRNNYIAEFFMYTEESAQPSPIPQLTASFMREASSGESSFKNPLMDLRNDLSIRTERLSELDRAGLSSDKSLYSFSIGNRSSAYLSSQSQKIGSVKFGGNSRKRNNAWQVKDEKCFFQPIRNKFYQKYVLQYTKYRQKTRRRNKVKKWEN